MAKLSLFLLVAPVAVAGGAPALAADDDGERHAYVSYNDLDLAKSDGQDMLRDRVFKAAHQVCGGNSLQRLTLRDHTLYVKCRDAAIRDAEPQLVMLFSGKKLASAGPLHVAAN